MFSVPAIAAQNCSGFPGSTCVLRCSTCDGRECDECNRGVHPLYRIPSPKWFDLPLLIVRYEPEVKDADVQAPFPL